MSLQKKFQEGFDSDDDDIVEEKSTVPLSRRISTSLTHFFYMARVFAKLNKKDISRRKGTYCLGVFSCFLVVVITALMMTTLGNLPVLFLRLGELESGQQDLILTVGGEASSAASLNYTMVKDMFPSGPWSYHTGRIIWNNVRIFNRLNCGPRISNDPMNVSHLWYPKGNDTFGAECGLARGCLSQHCSTNRDRRLTVVFIDTDAEKRMNLGRDWPADPPAANQVILSKGIAQLLGVDAGDHVLLQNEDTADSLLQAYKTAGMERFDPIAGEGLEYTPFGVSITAWEVAELVDESFGKFADSLTEFAILNYRTALSSVANGLSPIAPEEKRSAFAAVNPDTCASEILFNFPEQERLIWYGHSDYADVQTDAIRFASPVIAQLGFNQLDIDMPIVQYMYDSRFFALFLGLILSIIIVGLSFLSIILIYSLLIVGVETKTFELAVMRMVGMTRWNLVCYVLTNASAFAIPAWVLGLVIGQLAFLGIRSALASALQVDIPPSLSPDAIGYATLGGIGIPLISAIAPMMGVLGQDLPSALDTNRGKVETIKYEISRFGATHINWLQVGLGTALVIFGFLIYYLFPLALLSFNITLLFYIFFGMLLGMLFGCVLLAINFERIMETIVQYIFFFWEHDAIFTLIEKNMTAHRRRNRKTTLMYSMALGFIIFMTVAFQIQIASVEIDTARELGGELVIDRDGGMSYNDFIKVDEMLNDPTISQYMDGYTWITSRMTDQPTVGNNSLSTLGRLVDATTRTTGLAPNFFDVANRDFLDISREDLNSGLSLAEQLYTVEGSGSAIMGAAYIESMALDSLQDRLMFETRTDNINGSGTYRVVIRPAAFLNLAPVLRYSSFPRRTGQTTAVSLPMYLTHSKSINTLRLVRYGEVVVRCSETNVNALGFLLRQRLDIINPGIGLTNYYDEIDDLAVAEQVVGFFFIFTQVMAMVICFFSLMSSMAANIHEQAKEIGIMRAIGAKKFPLKRLYVEEAFVIVVSASFMGVVVGVGVAYTMNIQRSLFTQLPLPFVFPWTQVIIVVATAVLGAFLSSYGPITALLGSPSIPHILRRTI